MNNQINDIINYILETKCTIRNAAKQFNKSKSTIHRWIQRYMMSCEEEIYLKLREILDNNFSTKCKSGGKSFKNKYLGKKRVDIYKNSGYN